MSMVINSAHVKNIVYRFFTIEFFRYNGTYTDWEMIGRYGRIISSYNKYALDYLYNGNVDKDWTFDEAKKFVYTVFRNLSFDEAIDFSDDFYDCILRHVYFIYFGEEQE